MARDLAVAGDVFQAGELVGKDCSQEVFGFHTLKRSRNFDSSALARQSKGTRRVPPPPDRKHRRIKQRLRQEVTYGLGVQIAENLFERKRVLGAQREYNRVIRRRRLQLKIKRTAEPFAQFQAPSPIEPDAEWGVNDQLHPA